MIIPDNRETGYSNVLGSGWVWLSVEENQEIGKQPSAHDGVSWPMVALPNYDDNGQHRLSHVMAVEEGGGVQNLKAGIS